MHCTCVSTLQLLSSGTDRYATRCAVSSDRNLDRHLTTIARENSLLIGNTHNALQQHVVTQRNTRIEHNHTQCHSTHCTALEHSRRVFHTEYSSRTRRIRFTVMSVMYCINVESSSRIEFPRVDSCRSSDDFSSQLDVFRHAHTAFDANVRFDTCTCCRALV